MPADPQNPFDDKAIGLAMLGTVFFFAATGLGIGAFVQHPTVGGVSGLAFGILFGILVLPALMRDWQD